MPKVCNKCFSILHNTDSANYCPNCGQYELIEIDDMLVDIIVKFWSIGIKTDESCSGHLWEDLETDPTPFHPYISFGFKDENELNFLEEVLSEACKEKKMYNVEIMERLGKRSLQFESVTYPAPSARERLQIQFEFINLLYDITAVRLSSLKSKLTI